MKIVKVIKRLAGTTRPEPEAFASWFGEYEFVSNQHLFVFFRDCPSCGQIISETGWEARFQTGLTLAMRDHQGTWTLYIRTGPKPHNWEKIVARSHHKCNPPKSRARLSGEWVEIQVGEDRFFRRKPENLHLPPNGEWVEIPTRQALKLVGR